MNTQAEPPGGPEQAKRPRSIYAQLPEAFAYPFNGAGRGAIATGAVFFWVLSTFRDPFFSALIGGYNVIVGVILGGYLCTYVIKIVSSSAAGREEPPDWPDPRRFWDELLRPLLLVIATALFSFLPLIVRSVAARWGGNYDAPPKDELYWICLVWGLLYLPMGLIGVALFDSLMGLNPLLVIAGIVKTLPAYLFAVAIFFVCYFVSGWLQELISGAVPVVGSLVAGAVALYFLMVEMHVLGLIYNTHAKRLGWL